MRKVKKPIASKNRNILKCFEDYNYFFKQYIQQILQQLSSIYVQNHFFRHHSREFIKKRPFSIISGLKIWSPAILGIFDKSRGKKRHLKCLRSQGKKRPINWKLNFFMVWTEPNLSRKPRWSGAQPYLKTENNYSAKKIGSFGIIWEQTENEQSFVKKDDKTPGGQRCRLKIDKFKKTDIPYHFIF